MRLTLQKRVYKSSSVREAALAFSNIADIKIKPSGKDLLVVDITPTDPDVADVVVDEFLNHALVQTITDRG